MNLMSEISILLFFDLEKNRYKNTSRKSHYLFKFYFNIARDVIISKYRIFFNQCVRNIELITSRKLENFDRQVCRKAHQIFIALIIHIRLKLIMML